MVPIEPDRFVGLIAPLVARRDVHGIISTIRAHWTIPQVVCLLHSTCCDARKVAALSLSLIGGESCLDELARQLHDPDPVAAQMAEHAMWAIWFRSGSDQANSHLCRGTQALSRQELGAAIDHFGSAIEADPGFAEAYNQRAMIYYLQERFELSRADCQRAVDLQPLHFGAWAGLGHSYACLGEISRAIACYRRAKRINPRLECVDELIRELTEAAGAAGEVGRDISPNRRIDDEAA